MVEVVAMLGDVCVQGPGPRPAREHGPCRVVGRVQGQGVGVPTPAKTTRGGQGTLSDKIPNIRISAKGNFGEGSAD